MKIEAKTIDILKNFSTINPSLVIKKGNTLRTISEGKSIMAQAVVNDEFPSEFGIYELNQFLGLISLFGEPELEFEEKYVILSQGKMKSRYVYTDASNITSPPNKSIELPSIDCSTKISKEDLKRVLVAANQLSLPDIVIRVVDGVMYLTATDKKNSTTNEFSVDLGAATGDVEFAFKSENFKIIPDDYEVTISNRGISHFKGSVAEYWIALSVK